MPSSPPNDARRIFNGIGATYERAGAVLSFGQDARWRARLVDSLHAAPHDVVLDVATGTGLVARAVSERYGCEVVGLDRSADMLSAAAARDGHIPLVRARAESLPFADESFDHLTFTYLMRYVDDPAATMRELARVVRPGGRIAALDFGVPTNPLLRAMWRIYTSIGLPLFGRAISSQWASVGAFLRGSIERFDAAHPEQSVESYWRDAGLTEIHVAPMSRAASISSTVPSRYRTEPLTSSALRRMRRTGVESRRCARDRRDAPIAAATVAGSGAPFATALAKTGNPPHASANPTSECTTGTSSPYETTSAAPTATSTRNHGPSIAAATTPSATAPINPSEPSATRTPDGIRVPRGRPCNSSNECAAIPTARKNASKAPATIRGSGIGANAAPSKTYERCHSVYGGCRSVQ